MKSFFIAVILMFSLSTVVAKERIVSQSPFITYTLQYLGVEDRIVGVSRYDYLDLPKTGGIIDPDKVAIAGLHPDFIFTSDWTDPEVLRDVTPFGAKAIVLHGFKAMSEVEENIRAISEELKLPNGRKRSIEFASAWRKAAADVHGEGKRALVLSSCVGSPFSFGRDTYIFELFTEAGFTVVETHQTIRHLKKSEEIKTIDELLRQTRPDIVFVLHDSAHGCVANVPDEDVRIVELDGEHFVYPAPRILEGLKDLKAWKTL
ncbi:MAG: ABC transporter substrate-binding protein [Chlorobium phaeovibrioides]|nr:ABC transporter substrate-binding protein [Chlorobium phaeovibrioides]